MIREMIAIYPKRFMYKLLWKEEKKTLRSLSQAATFPSVYRIQWKLCTVSFTAENL